MWIASVPNTLGCNCLHPIHAYEAHYSIYSYPLPAMIEGIITVHSLFIVHVSPVTHLHTAPPPLLVPSPALPAFLPHNSHTLDALKLIHCLAHIHYT
jgi:hypothetical protein